MPGGLARIAATDGAVDVVSTQRGGGSKDIWVLPTRVLTPHGASRVTAARVPVRQDDMPSRLVENLYWFGRYTVRCEDKARLLRHARVAQRGRRLALCGRSSAASWACSPSTPSPRPRCVTMSNPHGIVADVRRLGWCASQVRSRLSAGCWRAVVELQRRCSRTSVRAR